MSDLTRFRGKKTSNDKLASARIFTIVCRPPRLKILILFMTFNILWHFRDLLGTFMTYTQFRKGVEVTLEDKLINRIDWSQYFQGFFQGCFQGYLDRISRVYTFHCFMILTSTIFLANLSAYVMTRTMWHKCSSKTRGQHNKQKPKNNTIYCMKFSFLVKMKNYFN